MAYTANVAELALTELLKGPTAEWATTLIPNFTTIKSVSVKNGVATVEFESPDTNEWSGGSCRVTAMHAQLEKTLTQFSTVQSVEISVNGETESIFQP
jgi:spore germination protein GerM